MTFNKGEQFTYHVNKDKRTIVAVLEVPETLIAEEMLAIMKKETQNYFAVTDVVVSNAMTLRGRYEGKAVCHNDDDWDEQKGMHIAKLRALRNYMADRKRISTLNLSLFEGILTRFNNADQYIDYSFEHIDDALKELDD